MAFVGGYLLVDGVVYNVMLSITLVWASFRLFTASSEYDDVSIQSFYF